MKLRKLSQLALASGIGLAVAATLTACQLVTVDYVFLAGGAGNTTSGGGIQTLAVDSESGALRFVNNTGTQPVDSGGSLPVSMAVSGTYSDLYVANQGNNSVVHLTIATNGSLTSADSVTLPEAPVAVALSPDGTLLFVASGTDSATLTEYSLSGGKIGAVVGGPETLTIPGSNAGDTVLPTALTTSANGTGVYVTVYDQSAYNPGGSITSTANPGWIFGFGIGSGGALTAANGSPYRAGVKPSGVVVDPASRFLYVTDFASSQLIGYNISSGTQLNFLTSGPYRTGNQPSAVTIDPRGKFIYVSNSLDNTVSAFAIDLVTGIPTAAVNTTGSTSNATDAQPNAIIVDPALGRFVYTANSIGGSISGFQLNPNTGAIAPTQATPYPSDLKLSTQSPSGLKPTAAIVSVPHGNHSGQVIIQ